MGLPRRASECHGGAVVVVAVGELGNILVVVVVLIFFLDGRLGGRWDLCVIDITQKAGNGTKWDKNGRKKVARAQLGTFRFADGGQRRTTGRLELSHNS